MPAKTFGQNTLELVKAIAVPRLRTEARSRAWFVSRVKQRPKRLVLPSPGEDGFDLVED